jgi:hypothetical protein
MTEHNNLWEEVSGMKAEIATIKARLDGHAPREWVRELVGPIQVAVTGMEQTVLGLSESAQKLFASHDELLKEKAAADRAELMAKTPLGLVKRYGPVIGFIVGCTAIYRILGTLAESWLHGHGFG